MNEGYIHGHRHSGRHHAGHGHYGRHGHPRFGKSHCGHPRGNGRFGASAFGDGLEARGGRTGGRGKSRRRIFSGDALRLLLLKLIGDTPRHGYDLIREIETRTGGAYAPSPGVVYPLLTLLEEMDFIAQQPGGTGKKTYAITPAGEAHLAEHVEMVTAILARLDSLGAARASDQSAPVRRAMGNLRQVLIARLESGELAEEQLHAIIDLIDDAARKIERLK